MGRLKKILSGDRGLLIRNFLSLGASRGIEMIVALLAIPLLISRVGLEGYGKYAFAYAVMFYFLNLTGYGFSLTAVREISQNRENLHKVNRIVSEVLSTALFLAAVSLVVLVALLLFVPEMQSEYMLYVYLVMMIFGDSFSLGWYFRGMEDMRFVTLLQLVSKSSFLLLVVFFVHSEGDYPLIALCNSVGFLVAGGVSFTFACRRFGLRFRLVSFRRVRRQLRMGFAAFATMISQQMIHVNSVVFLTGVFGTPVQVSFIEIASKILGAFNTAGNILSQALYPLISRRADKRKRLNRLLMGFGAAASVAMFFCSGFLVDLWLGGHNPEIIVSTRILSLCPFLFSVGAAYGVNGLMVYRCDRAYLWVVICSSLLGLAAGLALIPLFFNVGAAWSVVVARASMALLCFVVLMRLKPVSNR